MGLKIFKKLRRKRTTNSEKKNIIITESSEEDNNDIVTTITSESTTEDNNLQDKLIHGDESVISTVQEDDSRPIDDVESPKSSSGFDDMTETTPCVDYSDLLKFNEVNNLEAEAATKIQSIARRNMVMTQIENQNNDTSSNQSYEDDTMSEPVSSMPSFCGLGLLFNGSLSCDSKEQVREERWGDIARDDMKRKYMKSSLTTDD